MVLNIRIGAMVQKNPNDFLVPQTRGMKQRRCLAEINAIDLSPAITEEFDALGIVLHGQKMQRCLIQTIASGKEIRFCLEQFQSPRLVLDRCVDQLD